MKIIYKYINTFMLALTAIALNACNDKFLDRQPLDQVTESTFYKTEADAVAAINAAYDPLQWYLVYGRGDWHFRWLFGEVVSDNADKGGSGDNDQPTMLQLATFTANANNPNTEGEWATKYTGIYRCNLVLDKVPDIKMDKDLKTRILAESKFLRGYYYYELVTKFGGVPLITKVLLTTEYHLTRASKEECWAQIEQDLTEAAATLPEKGQYASTDLGRATKGAANGYLLKALAFQKKWAEAETVANTIINSGQYTLDPDYSNIFKQSGENGTGSVFEIQYRSGTNNNWGAPWLGEGNISNVFTRARGPFNGWGFLIPTQNLVDEFETGDPRLAATVVQAGDAVGDWGVYDPATLDPAYAYAARKFFIDMAEVPQGEEPALNGPGNDRILRYADILLLHAEAAYHNGNEAGARSSVNMVRARARNGNAAILPDVTTAGTDLLNAIYHERRVELALEGHRFFDLVRWGTVGHTMRKTGVNFIEGVHELFPVPQSQIDVTNALIVQNPGY